MITYLSIGDFSRATHMTVKTLRHYHETGLLEPADVDPHNGYRRYSVEQIPRAQVIRRLRDLDMPLDEIRAVLATTDLQTRNLRISGHLTRLEERLERMQHTVASLRDLLSPPATGAEPEISLRAVAPTEAAAVTAVVDAPDAAAWFQGALAELLATVAGQGLPETGPPGGVFAEELFTLHRGTCTIFVPCEGPVRPMGRVRPITVPGVELAVIEHRGPMTDVDRAYGALAAHVARHALAVSGPMREYYLVCRRETLDSGEWRTEVGWPVFGTG